LRDEPRVSVKIIRRAYPGFGSEQQSNRGLQNDQVTPASPVSSPGLGFVPQEELFASLTLRAARKYVRYSATLRSYSGFVDVPGALCQSLSS
jgi:hypothetical protein